MDLILGVLFKMVSYVAFGLILEVTFTAISAVTDGNITPEDRKLKGYVPLWMIPVYGILVTFVFEFVYFKMIMDTSIFFRYAIWCLTITGFEALAGWFYDRVMKVRPWDYTGQKTAILNGYTKLSLLPMWGIAGLVIEQYAKLVNYIVPSAVEYIRMMF